ncbi:MAG TPA: CHASE3 domain-containing protein, partial [Rhizomicrobium sp.]
MTVNRWLILAAAPIFLILGVIGFLAVQSAAGERDQQAWVLHTYQVMEQARKVQSDVLDAETGQRGYLLTHQPTYLAPYNIGVTAATRDIDALKQMTADNRSEQIRIGKLSALVGQRFGALDRTLAVGTANASPSPQLLNALSEGQTKMKALRGLIGSALGEERRLLNERIAARHLAEQREITAVIVASALALLVLLIAAILLVRNNLRLTKSEADRELQAA